MDCRRPILTGWLEKEVMSKINWFKPRHYLHFDPPVTKKVATEYVTNAKKVAAHSFYPLILNSVTSKKTKFDSIFLTFEKPAKIRPISYAGHMDSHIYAYYSSILNFSYELKLKESGLNSSVLAFRCLDGKSNIHHAHEAFEEIRSRVSCSVLCFDVEKFFDRLDHSVLKKAWQEVIGVTELPPDQYSVFRSITKHSQVSKDALFEALNISVHNPVVSNRRLCSASTFRSVIRDANLIVTNKSLRGIPQGSPISAVLSNIYMLSFDRAMLAYLSTSESAYYRYCDDILIVCPEALEDNIHEFVQLEIRKLFLDLQHAKTEIRQFSRDALGQLSSDKPIQYLGFMFDGEHSYIRPASLTRYYRKMRVRIKLAKKSRQRINLLRFERGEQPKELFLKSIYKGYSHLGRRNFITYGYRAAKIMSSATIRKQLRSHWVKLQREISST